jgi:hypothetical protein
MKNDSMFIFSTIVATLALAFWVTAAWHLAKKSGYRPWVGLLALVPLVNILLLFFWILDKWPVERELEQTRKQLGRYEEQYGPLH